MSDVNRKADRLLHQTVGDLRSSLDIETNLDVLTLALELAEKGVGYGRGVTARKMIKARINKLKKMVEKSLCQHCTSEFTCVHAGEYRQVCASFCDGRITQPEPEPQDEPKVPTREEAELMLGEWLIELERRGWTWEYCPDCEEQTTIVSPDGTVKTCNVCDGMWLSKIADYYPNEGKEGKA